MSEPLHSQSSGESSLQPSSVRKVIVASVIGTSLEWYDFFIYGTAAALVFNKLFFPSFEPAGRHAAGLRHLRRGFRRPDRSGAWCSGTTATGSAARMCWS